MGKITKHTEKIKNIIRIAFPLIIQGLVFQLQSLTDKAFLGNLDTRYVSAAGAAQMPYAATIDSMVAVSTGLIIITSKLFGANKKGQIASYVRSMALYHTMAGVVIFGLWHMFAHEILTFFQVDPSIIDYSISYVKICTAYLLFIGIDSSLQAMLQGMGDTKPVMYAGILKVGLNILISWILIFGKFGFPALYVTGAAIGTLVANLCSCLFLCIYCLVYKKHKYQILNMDQLRVSVKPYFEIIRLGVPVGLEYLLWNFSNLLLIRFINGFSYRDMAIYTLTFGFQCIIYVIFEGTSKATLSLIGRAIGAGKGQDGNSFFYITMVLNFIIVGLATICFFCFPKTLLSIFSNDTELIKRAVLFLEWIGIIMIPQSMNVICGNAIRAHGDTKWMFVSQIIGSTIIIGVSWFLVEILHMDMLAIYITIFLDEAARGGVNFLYYKHKYGKVMRANLNNKS
ncbi:MAG: MATE family efflux transporter [Clostridia bacterium]|nr:MATE family efflux transporter [Clostridia bacterium]